MSDSGIIYLDCPFAEKDMAKAFGAKWDQGKKKWYAPQGANNMNLFKRWLPNDLTTSDDIALVSTKIISPNKRKIEQTSETPSPQKRKTEDNNLSSPSSSRQLHTESADMGYQSLQSYTNDYLKRNEHNKGRCYEFVNHGHCLMLEAGLECPYKHSPSIDFHQLPINSPERLPAMRAIVADMLVEIRAKEAVKDAIQNSYHK
jgi:hypothetical protein